MIDDPGMRKRMVSELTKSFDTNKDGKLQRDELHGFFNDHENKHIWPGDVGKEAVDKIFDEFDKDSNGYLDVKELGAFIKFFATKVVNNPDLGKNMECG